VFLEPKQIVRKRKRY